MELKICGNKHNIQEVAELLPSYMGFIYYSKSGRNIDTPIPCIPAKIKKIGVFVNENLSFVKDKIQCEKLEGVQLHGRETKTYCKKLRFLFPKIILIKVFSIKDTFSFKRLEPFEPWVDFFLFDTKGKLAGGNGNTFNWNVLEKYPSSTPFFLSGGIGLHQIERIKKFIKLPIPLYGIDVNSAFEDRIGFKNITALQQFKKKLHL